MNYSTIIFFASLSIPYIRDVIGIKSRNTPHYKAKIRNLFEPQQNLYACSHLHWGLEQGGKIPSAIPLKKEDLPFQRLKASSIHVPFAPCSPRGCNSQVESKTAEIYNNKTQCEVFWTSGKGERNN